MLLRKGSSEWFREKKHETDNKTSNITDKLALCFLAVCLTVEVSGTWSNLKTNKKKCTLAQFS